MFAAAFHAAHARLKLQFADIDVKNFISTSQQFIADDAEQLADIAVGARASVQDDDSFHWVSRFIAFFYLLNT
jgi:hypothetical protein